MMFEIGQKVRFTNEKMHEAWPAFYPPAGWHGTIKEIDGDNHQALVEWVSGSGTEVDPDGGHAWWADYEKLEAVDES